MLWEDLQSCMKELGAELIGGADLRGIAGIRYSYGIAVAVPIPTYVLEDIQDGPTRSYLEAYHDLNAKLNAIVTAGEIWLQTRGYEAWAQTTDRVQRQENWTTPLPHKTVATRAGLGWIGKNCLLVTREFGPAVRLSSLLTNAPIPCGKPIPQSLCGNCQICRNACPAGALTGALWHVGMEREQLFKPQPCKQMQHLLMEQRTGLKEGLCGQCFVVCPYTRQYQKKVGQATVVAGR